MKNPVAYYLLLLYTATILQPIVPWAQDFMAHIFFEREHIATVHHENGKNHVHYELGNLTSKSNGNQSINNKNYSNVPLHIPIACKMVFNIQPYFAKIVSCNFKDKLPIVFAGIFVPPPEA